jgi:ribosome-binding factor A
VAHEVRLRLAPTLEFAEDPVPERTQRIERILADVRHDDATERSQGSGEPE